jgi:hypothetical protein
VVLSISERHRELLLPTRETASEGHEPTINECGVVVGDRSTSDNPAATTAPQHMYDPAATLVDHQPGATPDFFGSNGSIAAH